MTVLIMILILCNVILLFLYVALKKDVRELRKQMQYTNQEDSMFSFYTTSSDQDMKKISKELNQLREYYLKDRNRYMDMDQNFKRMITNVSHDIRTPLTSITGYIQLIEECEDPIDQERYYAIVYQRLDYLKSLLEELFLYTKITNDAIELNIEPICLYDKLCEILLYFHTQMKERNIDLDLNFQEERLLYYGDSMCIERIFNNICNNVVRHGYGTLSIHQELVEDEICIIFQNSVLHDDIRIEALFDRFYTADKARNNKNTGLGLAIVKELSEKLGGHVEANLKNKNLEIRLYLKQNQEYLSK